MGAQKKGEDRRARIARMQAEQRRAERRRNVAIIGTAAVVAIVLVGTAGLAVVRDQKSTGPAAGSSISGLKTYPGLTRFHVETAVNYPQTPPVGGNHAPVWTNCASYPAPVQDAQAVHSMEHGAVWITYRPGTPAKQVQTLNAFADSNGFVLVTPYRGLPAPIVASAWGKQITLQNADDPRLSKFVSAFAQSPKAPEAGAPCTGGTGAM